MKALLLCICFVTTYLRVAAQQITLTDTTHNYSISYPLYLEDRHASLTFEEIKKQNNKFVRATDKVPDFLGNFSKAIWYRFEVQNNSTHNNWYLEIKEGFMNRLSVYQISENGKAQLLTISGDNNFHLKMIQSSNLIFPITIPKGNKIKIYVRATSKTLIRTSMHISTMQKLYEDSMPIFYGDGFFTAITIALLLYNLFVYFSLREKVYLYYIGYISTSILHINLVAGHLQLFVPWLDWLNTTIILPIVFLFSILFTNSFLQARENAPFFYKMRWLAISFCLATLICYLTGWHGLAILMAAILTFVLFIYWILTAVMAYKNGFAPAIFYIVGFGSLILMSIVFELKMRGWLEENYLTDSSLFIGAAIEAVVLSFALASKFNFYKKEKERLQEQAYQQAIHFSRELINMQEAERKRIASELHDSLGQKLILIKNRILRGFSRGDTVQDKTQTDETLVQNVAEAIQEIRNISYALRPYQLDLLGLSSSINSLIDETCNAAQINYSIRIDNIDAAFDNDAKINIYRIVQECLNNIIKHAGAKNIHISLKLDRQNVKITITDDGVGFDICKPHAGFGLRGIKERLQILKGTMYVNVTSPKGTTFEFLVPTTNEICHEE
ncbi:7TM diverse intracellular signaling domain-containing protein [Pedobacter sp.]|uniref:sensor histidine kinase n=1 Tax=Pedobacter sp. TaxID=1411316 RepID=UPI0031E22E2B